jgi:hypothetical protein
MNTDSRYRKSIINTLIKKKIKRRIPININSGRGSAPKVSHIELKTPLADLGNNCAQYTYNINATINTKLSELPHDYNRVVFCIHRVVHCKIQQNVDMPFIQYLLYKYPEQKKDISNMLVFPFEKKGSKDIKSLASNYIKKIINDKLDMIGFIERNGIVYLFYDFTNIDNYIIKKIFLKTKKDTLWWCMMDEICNHKKVLQFPIHPSVYTLFYNNPALIYLKQDKRRLDIPIVAYYGNYFKFIPMVAALGQNAAMDVDGSMDDSYFFGSFRKGIRYGSWSPFYKQRISFDQNATDIDGKYNKGGIIRFALFMGKTKVLLDEPFENITKYVNDRNTWRLKYQSLFLGSIIFDKQTLNINPEYTVKNFDQQTPLSYHEIDKATLKSNWDPTYEKYNII